MRIIHTESSCGWGGQEIRILSESRGMIGRGHSVTIVCPPSSGIYQAAADYGVPAVAVPIYKKRLADFLALRRWLRDAGPIDVINTHSSTDSWLTALSCATIGGAPPIVRTRHISVPIAHTWSSRWLYARACRHVVTTGNQLRQEVMAATGLAPERVTSVPTGIDTDHFAPGDKLAARHALGLDTEAFIVGIVATLRRGKGHYHLIEALKNLPLKVQLVIVGDGPYRETLANQVSELDLAERIFFAGNRNDVLLWLQSFDIFAFPSYAEGVPQALMQAMAVGIPCITTAVGGIGEIAKDDETALIVKTRDSTTLIAAIEALQADDNLRSRLGQQARTHVTAHHSQEDMLDRMEAIFQSVCS